MTSARDRLVLDKCRERVGCRDAAGAFSRHREGPAALIEPPRAVLRAVLADMMCDEVQSGIEDEMSEISVSHLQPPPGLLLPFTVIVDDDGEERWITVVKLPCFLTESDKHNALRKRRYHHASKHIKCRLTKIRTPYSRAA